MILVNLIDFDREDCDNDGLPSYQDPFSCVSFDVPIAFTPNGDGYNDYLGYDNQAKVFRGRSDRGNFAGTLPEGTYFCFIDAGDR